MIFVTKDGKEFEDIKDARAHEKALKKAAARKPVNFDVLPSDLVEHAQDNLDSEVTRALINLGAYLSRQRTKAGLTKPRNRAA